MAQARSIVEPNRSKLTARERFRRQMHFQSIDRGVHWEFGYLGETITRWHTEGMPPYITRGEGAGSVESFFGVEGVVYLPIRVGLEPSFPWKFEVLEKKADSEVRRYADGHIQEEKTQGIRTIPHYIKFPIENRDDWKRFKERLDPATEARHQVDWKKLGEDLRLDPRPVGLHFGSFFGVPRDWIGFENLAILCYDDRPLVEEIVETLAVLMETQLSAALAEVQIDFACGWEDICFRNGPMISPTMFGEIVIPRVRRVMNIIRQHGCDVIWTDCDGDIRPLVPLWLDAGLNCMFPLEVHPGSDPVALRQQYGRQILLRGGIAKYELAKGRSEILAELKRIEKTFEDGGFIPHGDHRIPEDVPYDNYRYYIREKLAMMGWKSGDIDGIWPLQGLK